jgi:pilus assembly protein Flp/PilA
MKALVLRFSEQEPGTAVEYGLIAASIAIATFGALSSLGSSISGAFTTVSSSLE